MTSLSEYQTQVGQLHAQADAYARYYGLTGERDGAWDAFRHAFVSAEMSRVHGSFTTKMLGDLHELQGALTGQTKSSMNMDLWNNAAGRSIGEKSYGTIDTARQVKNALDNGSLIKDVTKDTRQYNSDREPVADVKDPQVCCDECGAADMFPLPPPPPYPNESVFLEDGDFFVIPPVTVPPFNTPIASRMALMESDESQTEQITSSAVSTELTTLPSLQAEVVAWAEPLQASVDSAMALIVETRTEVFQSPNAVVAEVEVTLDPILATLIHHRDVDTSVI